MFPCGLFLAVEKSIYLYSVKLLEKHSRADTEDIKHPQVLDSRLQIRPVYIFTLTFSLKPAIYFHDRVSFRIT